MTMLYPPDGQTRPLTVDDIRPGHVIRMTQSDGSFPPFSDTVILGIARPPHDDLGQGLAGHDEIKLARPFLYASGTETCCPSSLTGVEEYKATVDSLLGRYVLVLTGSGKPHSFLQGPKPPPDQWP